MQEKIDEVTKLQVGCGPHNLLAGWCNVDIRDFKGIDHVMDVTQPWPWTDTLQYVYGEHFLEHLSLEEGLVFLQHARNALKTGGKVRLSTPSLERVMKTHFTFNEAGEKNRLEQTWAINRAFHGWGHQFLYSKTMLKALLKAVGFSEISFYDYGHSEDAILRGLERHGGCSFAAGYPSVWIVEASKKAKELNIDKGFVRQADEMYTQYVKAGH